MASLGTLLLAFFVAVPAAHVSSAPSAQAHITPVKVGVYYEALCPDSKRFFLRQLWPTYKKLENGINLNLIPYGNAKVSGSPGRWTFQCQHGPEECLGNMIQTCAIEVVNNTMDSLKFVVCAFQSLRQEDIIEQCIHDRDLQLKVKACANGSMGKNLEHQMGMLTQSLKPPQNFIPWITINLQGSSDINNKANWDFFDLVCNSFEGDRPSPCPSPLRRKKAIDYYERGMNL